MGMLDEILKVMYIDPELLEELSDDQKQILFFKMREEQIRRWKVVEEKHDVEQKQNPKIKKTSKKNVKFYCDQNDKPIIEIITEHEEDFFALKKEQEALALKCAEEQAHREAEEKRKKEIKEIEARRKEEEQRIKEEEEKLAKEREKKEAELLKRQEKEAALHHSMHIQEAKLAKERAELERIEMERKKHEAEEKWRKAKQEIQEREEAARIKREEELQEQERKRKEELYEHMKKQQEQKQKQEEEEACRLQKEWEEREIKAKEADKERRSSFNYTRTEYEKLRKLAQEKAELQKYKKETTLEMPEEEDNVEKEKEKARKVLSVAINNKTPIKKKSKKWNKPPSHPPLPARPTISMPVNVTTTKNEGETIPVKRNISKPSSRPPPVPPNSGNSPIITDGRPTLPVRPSRPNNRAEVSSWWKEVEFAKHSGLDENNKPLQWFHGIISRQEAESLLQNKSKGTYLVRVSERVWGYTVSYKDVARCKHFLINTSPEGYTFFGTEQVTHKTLNELVSYHKRHPVSGLGQEILIEPCGQGHSPPDYFELFVENTSI